MKLRIAHFAAVMLGLSLIQGLSGTARADVTINATRVVYPADQREVGVKLSNAGTRPALIQAWVDSGDPKQSPDTSTAPFLISPPVVRIEPGKGQTIRLIHTGGDTPTDRESVFWLNVLEVPPGVDPATVGQNHLQIAFRTRVKLFFRPTGLSGRADEVPAQLKWRIARSADGSGWALGTENTSAYHVSFNEVTLDAGGKPFKFDNPGMLAPGERLNLPLPGLSAAAAAAKVGYTAINDYGGRATFSTSLEP